VKLSGLAKFYASDVESAVTRHPRVRSPFMGGEGRQVPFLLVEAKGSTQGLIVELWEILKMVNGRASEAIRISKDMIMSADPKRPFRRTAKRTLDRRVILADYQADIDALYGSSIARL